MADRLSELASVLETLDAHGLQTAAERVRWAIAEIERLRKVAANKRTVTHDMPDACASHLGFNPFCPFCVEDLSGGAHE